MAEKLEFVEGYDFASDSGTVSLLSYTDGFTPAYDGWSPRTDPDREGFVNEVITLRARGTSIDNLASRLQALSRKTYAAYRYRDTEIEPNGVWLRVQMDGETKARQSWVSEIQQGPESSIYTAALRQRYHHNEYKLGIKRMPWWETTTAGTIASTATISTLGGTLAYSAIGGDLPARIGLVKIFGPVDKNGTVYMYPKGDTWMGFRSNRYGNAGSFNPFVNFGTVGGGTALADAESRDGTAISYTINTDAQIFYGAGNVTKNEYGEFLVLARVKISDGTALMQMQTAWDDDYSGSGTARVYNATRTYPRIYLDPAGGTLYRFYEMGVVRIPDPPKATNVYNNYTGGAALTTYNSFVINTQRTAGTPVVTLDGLYLIPTEGMIRMGYSDNTPQYIWDEIDPVPAMYGITTQGPTGEVQTMYSLSKNSITYAGAKPLIMGGVPPNDSGVIVMCGQHYNESSTSLVFYEALIRYFERYREMRGNG